DQAKKDVSPFGPAQVQSEASFVAIDGGMEDRHGLLETGQKWRQPTGDLAPWHLDLDDVRAEIAEEAAAQRARPGGRRLEDSQTRQRSGKVLVGVPIEFGFLHRPASAFIVQGSKNFTSGELSLETIPGPIRNPKYSWRPFNLALATRL